MDTELGNKMRALADTGHARRRELRMFAEAFDKAVEEHGGLDGDPRKLLGAWARARRVYCQCTGEPLI